MKYIDKHWSPAIQMKKIVAFSEAVYSKIADGSIGTEESMGWFRREIHVAMPHTSETRYGSAHCYRSLLDVLSMSVPGDNFFSDGKWGRLQRVQALHLSGSHQPERVQQVCWLCVLYDVLLLAPVVGVV